MSDEESFVILGTSPMSSLEVEGIANGNNSSSSSLVSDTPVSCSTSLKSSQISDLRNTQEIATQTPDAEEQLTQPEMETASEAEKKHKIIPHNTRSMIKDIQREETKPQMPETIITSNYNVQPEKAEPKIRKKIQTQDVEIEQMSKETINQSLEQKEADAKIWRIRNYSMSNLEFLKSNIFVEQEHQEMEEKKQTMANDDDLKNSAHSEFPSTSQTSTQGLLKLMYDNNVLTNTVITANESIKQLYQNVLNLKQKKKALEEQLDNYRREIEMLCKQNHELERNFKEHIEAIEVARKKDREEIVQIISEKKALIENLKAEIIKLEKKQLANFEFVQQNQSAQENEQFNKYYISRREHENSVKDIERKLSEMLAQNLGFKDIEKQYIDELNCLKVNLTAAEELLKENKAKISELQIRDAEKQQQIEILEFTIAELRETCKKQNERIILLEHQTELHRKDFEMEQQSRETAVKEKRQILQDLRSLQRHNQELIEEHQKLVENYEKKLLASRETNTTQIAAASAAASNYFNNLQRPIRALPSSDGSSSATPGLMHFCPICHKAYKSLNILQSHVNDCMDKL